MEKLKTGKYLLKQSHFLGGIRKTDKSPFWSLERNPFVVKNLRPFTIIHAAKRSSHTISKRILKTVVQKKSKKINKYKTTNIFQRNVLKTVTFTKKCEFVLNEKRILSMKDQRLISQITYTALIT